MVKKDVEKIDQASDLNLTRRNVLGAGALVAGAGILIQFPGLLMQREATIRSKSVFKPTELELAHYTVGGMNVPQTQLQSTLTV